MSESIQTYMCLLCQEEKNTWAIINHSPNWRKDFTYLKNEYICRACANHEGSTDRIKLAVDSIRESKRKSRHTEYDPIATANADHITKYQGRVGNGNLFNFIITFTTSDNYHITIADGYHEGYKFDTYVQFCNFLKQNQYDPNKLPINYFDGRRWLPCIHLFEKSGHETPSPIHQAMKAKVTGPVGGIEKPHNERPPVPNVHARSPEELKQYGNVDPRLMVPEWFHHQRYAQNAFGLPLQNGMGVSPAMLPYPAHMDSKLHNRRRAAQYAYPPAALGLTDNLALYGRLPKPMGGGLYANEVYNNSMMQSALFKTQMNSPLNQPAPATDNKTVASPFTVESDVSV